MSPHPMHLEPIGETDLLVTRRLDAPCETVWRALSEPALIRQWLLGPPGWTMPVCEVDFRVGGAYRYVWEKNGTRMGMGGTFLEIVRPERIVTTERFDESWYPGEAVGTQELVDAGDHTLYRLTVRYQSLAARAMALESGMAKGMEYGYDRLEELLRGMV